jgi:hypothetical protein
MPLNFNTGVPSLDHTHLKSDFIAFLSGQEKFNSYKFEGSALSTIIDLLTKNTHYLSYVANMMARESFLSRAVLRKNVVAHARKLSYIPNSKTCAMLYADIEVLPSEDTNVYPDYITMVANTKLVSEYDGEVVNFSNMEDVILYRTNSNTYKNTNILLYQGDLIEETFEYTNGNQKFVLTNENIDISTLQVYIIDHAESTNREKFDRITNIADVNSGSKVYYLYEDITGSYAIEFGDGVLGKTLVNGNIVSVAYMVHEDSVYANGVDSLTLVTDIDGFVDANITVNVPANGGSDRESIEQIRMRAPLAWEAQGRSVTANDYVVNLLRVWPQAKSAIAWGGEEMNPPQWGKVLIAVNPRDGIQLSQPIKNSIVNKMKDNSVLSISIEIVEPVYIDIDISLSVGFDRIKSNLTLQQEINEIVSTCYSYSNSYLNDFGQHFIESDLSARLKSRDGVNSVTIRSTLKSKVNVSVNSINICNFSFNNSIEPNSIIIDGFEVYAVETARIKDDGQGRLYLERKLDQDWELLQNDVGTVDYTQGKIEWNFTPVANEIGMKYVNVTAIPSLEEILAQNQIVLRFGDVKVSENVKLTKRY